MKSESKMEKIKKVIKAKDSRFWLMIFVTASTLFVLVLWSMNLRNIFPQSISFASDSQALGLDNINKDVVSISDDFSIFLERLEKAEQDLNQEEGSNSNIKKQEIDELKKILEDKLNNGDVDDVNNPNSKNISNSNNTSSIPILSQDLDNSEQEIRELKKRLEELENKLGQ